MGRMGNFFQKRSETIYAIFRILVGLLFLQHGVQKLFGVFGFPAPAPVFSLMWFAGYIELLGGLAITIGFFTRYAALAGALEMLIAYFYQHLPNGFLPIVNQGELSLLYFLSFLVLLVNGCGRWGIKSLFPGSKGKK
ncbi:DoxX family protein [Candidatus Woesearchaeota archaeon]|nr:DoxX family protein [Candidatus Woesearchaeota archaeon]